MMLLQKVTNRLWILLMLLIIPEMVFAASSPPLLRHGTYALPLSLDPAWGTTVSDIMLKVNLYEGLTTYDKAGNVVPGAAQRWEVSEDGLQYTFYLRRNLRWSNGSPITAQQFANTILRVLQGGGDNQPTFHYILLKNANEILQKQQPLSALGMEVINQYTLRFKLTRPAPYFPNILVVSSFPTPEPIGSSLSPKELKPTQWVTNGAYQVSIYDPDKQQYQFIKNPFYRNNQHTYFETVQMQHYPKPNEALFALLNDQLDSYDRVAHLKAMSANNERVKVIPLGAAITTYLVVNFQDKALKEKRIRQALSLALDRSAIVKALGYNDTQRTFSLSPSYPEVNWHKLPAAWGKETINSRRQRAIKLMAEAGYDVNQRLKLELLVNKGDANELLGELVRRQWGTIGVDLTVISQPTAIHYGQYLAKGHFQVARVGWGAVYPDPSGFLETLHPSQRSNFGHWEHTVYTKKLNQLLQQRLTLKQRGTAFFTLETIIQQELPIIPIYNKSNVALLAPWLKAVNQQWSTYLLWHFFQPEKHHNNLPPPPPPSLTPINQAD